MIDLKRSLLLVSTLVIGSVVAGLAIPTFIPSIRGVNSHSLQIGQVVDNVTLHISVPSKSLYYVCILPIVYGGPDFSTNSAPQPEPSHAFFIDVTDTALCHHVKSSIMTRTTR